VYPIQLKVANRQTATILVYLLKISNRQTTQMKKLTKYTTFNDLKSDESHAKVSSVKAKKLALEFESFIISVQKEMNKKSKDSYGKKR
jgi:hypothetical protein